MSELNEVTAVRRPPMRKKRASRKGGNFLVFAFLALCIYLLVSLTLDYLDRPFAALGKGVFVGLLVMAVAGLSRGGRKRKNTTRVVESPQTAVSREGTTVKKTVIREEVL